MASKYCIPRFDETLTRLNPLISASSRSVRKCSRSFRSPKWRCFSRRIFRRAGTALGAALKKVTECANSEVHKSALKKGDWKPLVFILTDGVPTDDVSKGLEIFREYAWGAVVACAAGNAADDQELQKITDDVLHLDVADANSIGAYFKWVSASITTGSKRIDCGGEIAGLEELPPPPPEITLVKP